MTTIYPPATRHGKIQQIFDDLFFVQGSIDMAPGIRISRNMIIVRQRSELTLISAIRLDDAGLQELESLGSIKHVVRLGDYHLGHMNGVDDGFYLDRYDAKLWLLPGMRIKAQVTDIQYLSVDNMPLSNAGLFVYASSPMPEGLILLPQNGGVLIAADSLQNWAIADAHFSPQAADMMKNAGFIKPANIGPEWKRANAPSAEDFLAVGQLAFRHLLPSHGQPLLDSAKVDICTRIDGLINTGELV